jgi:hypothetical protein
LVFILNRVLRRLPYDRNRATTRFITPIRSASDGNQAAKKIGTVALHNAPPASKSASAPLKGAPVATFRIKTKVPKDGWGKINRAARRHMGGASDKLTSIDHQKGHLLSSAKAAMLPTPKSIRLSRRWFRRIG